MITFTVKTATIEDLDTFYEDWSFTLEGIEDSNEQYDALIRWILDYTTFVNDSVTVYRVSGKLMNNMYKLTGNNAYPPDLNIAIIKLSEIEDVGMRYSGFKYRQDGFMISWKITKGEKSKIN